MEMLTLITFMLYGLKLKDDDQETLGIINGYYGPRQKVRLGIKAKPGRGQKLIKMQDVIVR